MKGLIFSIEEFAVFDGNGIRVNVFFKGCPLRCRWCHNPEGWENKVQIVKNPNNCLNCGMCTHICTSPDECKLCGNCVINCPRNLIRTSGEWIEADDLAKRLLSYAPILKTSGGGLTFSGGEILMQPEFLSELLEKTASMNRVLETSGFGNSEKWRRILKLSDFVYYDLKVMDEEKHIKYTGVSNKIILKNAKILFESGVPCTVRVPFIKDINTDEENLTALCEFVKDAENLEAVEFLNYNTLAGAKYKLVGKEYIYNFEKPDETDYERVDRIFNSYGINYIKER